MAGHAHAVQVGSVPPVAAPTARVVVVHLAGCAEAAGVLVATLPQVPYQDLLTSLAPPSGPELGCLHAACTRRMVERPEYRTGRRIPTKGRCRRRRSATGGVPS